MSATITGTISLEESSFEYVKIGTHVLGLTEWEGRVRLNHQEEVVVAPSRRPERAKSRRRTSHIRPAKMADACQPMCRNKQVEKIEYLNPRKR